MRLRRRRTRNRLKIHSQLKIHINTHTFLDIKKILKTYLFNAFLFWKIWNLVHLRARAISALHEIVHLKLLTLSSKSREKDSGGGGGGGDAGGDDSSGVTIQKKGDARKKENLTSIRGHRQGKYFLMWNWRKLFRSPVLTDFVFEKLRGRNSSMKNFRQTETVTKYKT